MSVIVIGDSHAGGLCGPLRALLGARCDSGTFTNGATTRAFLGRAFVADLIIVVLGTNDIWNRIPPDETGANADIIERAQSGRVLWVGPPRYDRDRGTTEALAAYTSWFFDSRAVADPDTGDGVHLSVAGYRAWAYAIAAEANCVRDLQMKLDGALRRLLQSEK